MIKLSNVVPQLKALNWTKVILYLVIAVALVGFGYLQGRHTAEQKCQAELGKDMVVLMEETQRQIAENNKELLKRVDVAAKATENTAVLNTEMKAIRGELNEAIKARADNPTCAPTSDEWRLYDEAARKTRR